MNDTARTKLHGSMPADQHTRGVSSVNDHRPRGQFRRSGNRTFRGVTLVAFLFVLTSTVYFADDSLNTDQPILDLSGTAILGLADDQHAQFGGFFRV